MILSNLQLIQTHINLIVWLTLKPTSLPHTNNVMQLLFFLHLKFSSNKIGQTFYSYKISQHNE
jgi:heme/copper-type cytochrome/quinol oxidase subunit 4